MGTCDEVEVVLIATAIYPLSQRDEIGLLPSETLAGRRMEKWARE